MKCRVIGIASQIEARPRGERGPPTVNMVVVCLMLLLIFNRGSRFKIIAFNVSHRHIHRLYLSSNCKGLFKTLVYFIFSPIDVHHFRYKCPFTLYSDILSISSLSSRKHLKSIGISIRGFNKYVYI